MSARIGITSSLKDGEDPYARPSRANYGFAVRAAGGEPHFTLNDLALVDRYVAEFDGWVLAGGNDVDPVRYGGRRDAPGLDEFDAERDAFELAIIARVLDAQIPVLFICRGIQILNVALGGSLIEDIPSEPNAQRFTTHAQHLLDPPIEREHVLDDHLVQLEAGSRLAAVLGCAELKTNSLHHQAIRALAPALRVSGTTSDGVIEGIDGPANQSFCVGVQWHPEALADAPSSRLFAGLVAAAERNRAGVRTSSPGPLFDRS